MSVIIENTVVCKLDKLSEIKDKLRDYVGHSLVEHFKDKEYALISFDTNGDSDYFGPKPLLSSDDYLIKETMNEDGEIETIYGSALINQRISYFIKNGFLFHDIDDSKRDKLIANIRYWCEN